MTSRSNEFYYNPANYGISKHIFSTNKKRLPISNEPRMTTEEFQKSSEVTDRESKEVEKMERFCSKI